MRAGDKLTPIQVLQILLRKTRKRRECLEGVRLSEYSIALYELGIIEDLLKRAIAYMERIS